MAKETPPKKEFKLNPGQIEALRLSNKCTYFLARGGSGSAKSTLLAYRVIMRALGAPGSRHGVFRKTAISCGQTLFDLTFPKTIKMIWPGLWEELETNRSEKTIRFLNGSIIIFGGLDDEAKMDRILGQEFSTIWCNEITEFPNYDLIEQLESRLRQECMTQYGKPSSNKFFFDCNPDSDRHWSHDLFFKKINPTSRLPLPNPDDYQEYKLDPLDNASNLNPNYVTRLQNMSGDKRRRFWDGEYKTEVDGALFQQGWIDDNRVVGDFDHLDLVRIVVAIDPSVSATTKSDETGLMVVGIDENGHCYVLQDASGVMLPQQWAKVAEELYRKWNADIIVAEKNNGGEMVGLTLKTAGINLPVKLVWASKSKSIRAEPISTLYNENKVSHVGEFRELESQMTSFSLSYNRTKQGSPDRLDALVWGLWELTQEKTVTHASISSSTGQGYW